MTPTGKRNAHVEFAVTDTLKTIFSVPVMVDQGNEVHFTPNRVNVARSDGSEVDLVRKV